MKYENLYNRIMDCDVVAMIPEEYPETILIPTEGYIVPEPSLERLADSTNFDSVLDEALADTNLADRDALLFTRLADTGEIIIEVGVWLKSKDYVFGYAHGIGADVVYDCFNSRLIYMEEDI